MYGFYHSPSLPSTISGANPPSSPTPVAEEDKSIRTGSVAKCSWCTHKLSHVCFLSSFSDGGKLRCPFSWLLWSLQRLVKLVWFQVFWSVSQDLTYGHNHKLLYGQPVPWMSSTVDNIHRRYRKSDARIPAQFSNIAIERNFLQKTQSVMIRLCQSHSNIFYNVPTFSCAAAFATAIDTAKIALAPRRPKKLQ